MCPAFEELVGTNRDGATDHVRSLRGEEVFGEENSVSSAEVMFSCRSMMWRLPEVLVRCRGLQLKVWTL